MKIVLVAGGSGGHIYPALSLAKELVKNKHQVLFIGSTYRIEKEIIPASGFPFIGLDIKTTRGNIKQKIKSLLSMIKAYRRAKNILKQDVDLVIGFGNYISVPVILAAKHLKIKTVIHEQNSFVGRANAYLDCKVDCVIGSYEENAKQFKNKNFYLIGNPQASSAYYASKDENFLSSLGIDSSKPLVTFFFGSLGSESLCKLVLELIKTNPSYQILYATGTNNFAKAKPFRREGVFIVERVDGIQAMLHSDLLVARAGATTIAEICATGTSSLLIPSPFVPNNHQYYNAKALASKKAAILVEEKDLTVGNLALTIDNLLANKKERISIGKQAKSLANPQVLKMIVERIEKL